MKPVLLFEQADKMVGLRKPIEWSVGDRGAYPPHPGVRESQVFERGQILRFLFRIRSFDAHSICRVFVNETHENHGTESRRLMGEMALLRGFLQSVFRVRVVTFVDSSFFHPFRQKSYLM